MKDILLPVRSEKHQGQFVLILLRDVSDPEGRKRKYIAVFTNKLTDAMQEASETQCWLEFSLACKYIRKSTFAELDNTYEQILLMLNSMEKNAKKFCF